ncbi:hypothetical protein D9758_003606 [Tetrapyrgos nigripes]|uniref:MICOS complex subunit MIC12 n=1 Tax=Tetrapyrgos nigripes TaxID=182062 RepID=A0A8H5GM46_9AGAR|nr:hypothetical protein D9758_003606 [Tetrapyrgos nigripes]
MSFLIGPASGALVAGGVYYGFSNLIQTRTQQLSTDLHIQSVRLVETPNVIQAPPPAASRIPEKTFSTLLQTKWNEQIEGVFNWARESDKRAVELARKMLYGLPEDK